METIQFSSFTQEECYLDFILLLKKKSEFVLFNTVMTVWKSPERTTMDSLRDAALVTLSVCLKLVCVSYTSSEGTFVLP